MATCEFTAVATCEFTAVATAFGQSTAASTSHAHALSSPSTWPPVNSQHALSSPSTASRHGTATSASHASCRVARLYFIHLPACLLTYSRTRVLTCLLTYLRPYSRTQVLTCLLAHLRTHVLTYSRTHVLTYSRTHILTYLLTHVVPTSYPRLPTRYPRLPNLDFLPTDTGVRGHACAVGVAACTHEQTLAPAATYCIHVASTYS